MREEGQVDRRVSNVGEVFQPRHSEARKLRLREEARGFAKMCSAYADIETTSFLRDAFIKAGEVINDLCDSIEIQKEKIEGEEGKENLPPTPPIREKGEEGEEKKDSLPNACAREEAIRATDRAIDHELREAKLVFEEFWSKYPTGHKVSKKTCQTKVISLYREAKDKAKFINEFFSGLDKWLSSERWSEGIICNPKTFLNQERWLCEPEPSRAAMRNADEEALMAGRESARKALKELGL